MEVYHGFYISGKNFKMKEKSMPIWTTTAFFFSCSIAIKMTVSDEIFCSCKGKC